MRSFAAATLDWLHQLALAVWLGGIVTLGAVTAPAIFGTAKAAGDTRWGDPLYTFAGTAIGEAFRRFNYVVLIAGALMLAAGLGCGVLARVCRRRLLTRTVLTGVSWGIAAWLAWALYPRLIDARGAGDMALFDQLHRTYSTGFSVQMLLLLAVAGLTAWLRVDPRPQAEARAAQQPRRWPRGPVTAP